MFLQLILLLLIRGTYAAMYSDSADDCAGLPRWSVDPHDIGESNNVMIYPEGDFIVVSISFSQPPHVASAKVFKYFAVFLRLIVFVCIQFPDP